MVGPNATKFGPKIGIFCQSMTVHAGVINDLLSVGWWLWRTGFTRKTAIVM